MKRSKMLVLMIIVVAAHMTIQNDTCSDSNPFLLKLAHFPNAVLQAPIFDKSRCPFEWVNGTCCNGDSLVRWVKEDAEKIATSVVKVSGYIQKYVEFFNELAANCERIASAGLNSLNSNRLTLVQTIREEKVKAAIAKLGKLDSTSSLTACYNHVAMIRSNAVCSLCSVRWSPFFANVAEKKVWITKDTCFAAAKVCKQAYHDLVEFIELVDKINKPLLKAFVDPNLTAPEAVKFFKVTREWVDEMEKKNIKQLVYSNESDKQYLLCEYTLQVMGQTLIQRLANQFDSLDLSKLKSFNKSIKDKIESKTLSSRLRILQADANSNFGFTDALFVGDVKVMSGTDSSYSSSTGAIGASGNENSIHLNAMPLNITSKFP